MCLVVKAATFMSFDWLIISSLFEFTSSLGTWVSACLYVDWTLSLKLHKKVLKQNTKNELFLVYLAQP